MQPIPLSRLKKKKKERKKISKETKKTTTLHYTWLGVSKQFSLHKMDDFHIQRQYTKSKRWPRNHMRRNAEQSEDSCALQT